MIEVLLLFLIKLTSNIPNLAGKCHLSCLKKTVTAVTCPSHRGEIRYHRSDFANAPRCVLEAVRYVSYEP